MPILKVQDFNKLVSSKKIFPVYLFAGEEPYLISTCLDKTENLIAANNLNKEIFYAAESSAEDILNAIWTLPFLSEIRIVIVKDVNKMKAADAERLTSYLSNVIDTSCLILLYSCNYKKETIVKRKELVNKCITSKDCVFVDCRKQYENEVKEFIKSEFAKRGNTVSHNAVLRIIDENGTDLLNILNEIDKVSLFAGKNRKDITEKDLENISGYTKEVNIYALSSNIETRDLKKAVFVLEKLLSQGEEPVMILSAISSAVRKILNAKSMIGEQNMSVAEIASTLRIHNFYATAFFTNLKKHDTKTLQESLKIILKADTAIKTGSSDAISVLEKTILFICK